MQLCGNDVRKKQIFSLFIKRYSFDPEINKIKGEIFLSKFTGLLAKYNIDIES